MVVSGEGDWSLVTRFDLLLGLEGPELDLDGADDDVVGDRVVFERAKDVLRTVSDTINDGLDALIVPCIPDLDHLVSAERDQMVPLLVDVEVGH